MAVLTDNLCVFLDWDSRFFGFRIAQLNVKSLKPEYIPEINNWCHRNGISCLYFLADFDSPESIKIAEENSFRLVDIRVELERTIDESYGSDYQYNNLILRDAETADIELLQDIAKKSFTSSRFYFDLRFPRDLCDSFYATWIKVSFEGYAQKVLVAELEGKSVGFITCHLEKGSDSGRIGLVGLRDEARGKGIGQILVHQALSWFSVEGIKSVRIVTQGRNVPAQRLYEKCGFLTRSAQLWYHKWY